MQAQGMSTAQEASTFALETSNWFRAAPVCMHHERVTPSEFSEAEQLRCPMAAVSHMPPPSRGSPRRLGKAVVSHPAARSLRSRRPKIAHEARSPSARMACSANPRSAPRVGTARNDPPSNGREAWPSSMSDGLVRPPAAVLRN